MKMPVAAYGAYGKKLSPYLRLAAAIVIAVLAFFALIRAVSWHKLDESRRLLTMVNPWNPVSETGYSAKLTDAENGLQVDRACAEALRELLADCRGAGCRPLLTAAYRSVDDQLVLRDQEIQNRVDAGMNPEEAEAEVSKRIALPGRSEHELGLAVDIVDAENPVLEEEQVETATARWLEENAWRYGFIQRYPLGSDEITGYGWHPWHYRYVGEDAAGNIHSLGITLEEYLSLFYSDEAAVVYDQK